MSQAGTEQTFQDLSKHVVERFLQTVVVLDDGATMDPSPSVRRVVEPDSDEPILEEGPDEIHAVPAVSVGSRNSLDAKALILGFADHGLVCAVLAPSSDTDVASPTVRASRRADIVILDWQLGDQGEKTRDIIKTLIAQDRDAGGRLRMIVVYTQNNDLEGIRARVSEALLDDSLAPDERPGKVLTLTGQHTRILFIQKGKTSSLTGQVNEVDLPSRVVEEFIEVGKGILANVALAGIAAIRDETHRVLARFHPGLDAPFLTHRILLKNPSDAEGYSVDLLSSEIFTLLRHRGIGSKYAGREAIRLALAEYECDGRKFRLMTANDSEENAKQITLENLMKLVDCGPSGLEGINNVGVRKLFPNRLYLLFSESLEKGQTSYYEFARTSAHVREHATVGTAYRAKLDLGSIIMCGNEYLVCIQPSCDAVRLSGATQFIFAELSKDSKTFDVVVRDLKGEDVCLKLNAKACKIRTVKFNPEGSTGIVSSSTDEDGRKFTSIACEAQEFTWICDLKISFAQRFVHRIATNLSRIGLDEFEWQRDQSPRS